MVRHIAWLPLAVAVLLPAVPRSAVAGSDQGIARQGTVIQLFGKTLCIGAPAGATCDWRLEPTSQPAPAERGGWTFTLFGRTVCLGRTSAEVSCDVHLLPPAVPQREQRAAAPPAREVAPGVLEILGVRVCQAPAPGQACDAHWPAPEPVGARDGQVAI
jgi:hypothetical protein